MTYPNVSIIILNWNGWKDTIECLESVYQITYPSYDVIVLDNGSEDESIERINEYCKGKIEVESKFFEYSGKNKPIKIIEYTREDVEAGGEKEQEIIELPSNKKLIFIKNEKNYGFAEGNNIGMRYALKALNPNYILLLNNDTAVDKAFLGELVKVAVQDERVGVVGPKIYFYDFKGRKDVISFIGEALIMWKGETIRYGEGEVDRKQYDNTIEMDKIEGSCMLIKKDLLQNVGLFDLRYFTYWEDTDLCIRAYRKGYRVLYAPKARIWHKIAKSSGGMSGPHHIYIYYMTRNRFLFMKQHATKQHLLSFLLYFFGFQFWFTSGIFVLYHRDVKNFVSFFRGVIDGLRIIRQ
jgi:GT2 family glycosyltransferase